MDEQTPKVIVSDSDTVPQSATPTISHSPGNENERVSDIECKFVSRAHMVRGIGAETASTVNCTIGGMPCDGDRIGRASCPLWVCAKALCLLAEAAIPKYS